MAKRFDEMEGAIWIDLTTTAREPSQNLVVHFPFRSPAFPIPESRITIPGLYWNRIE